MGRYNKRMETVILPGGSRVLRAGTPRPFLDIGLWILHLKKHRLYNSKYLYPILLDLYIKIYILLSNIY